MDGLNVAKLEISSKTVSKTFRRWLQGELDNVLVGWRKISWVAWWITLRITRWGGWSMA